MLDGKVVDVSREINYKVAREKRHGHKGVSTRYIFI